MLRQQLPVRLTNALSYFQKACNFPLLICPGSRNGTSKKCWMDRNGKLTSLQPCDPTVQVALTPWHGTSLSVSIEAAIEASLRFFRTSTLDPFQSVTDYDEAFFLQTRIWEQVFFVKPNNSIGFQPENATQLHKEATQGALEMFGYGMAIYAAAKVLGVPTNRFFFLDAEGARPDFDVQVTIAELKKAGFTGKVLGPAGKLVSLEVKARRCNIKGRSDTIPKNLLLDFEAKMQGLQGHFIGVYVAVPDQNMHDSGETRIVISDPGEEYLMEFDMQSEILLSEIFFLCYRFGLWSTGHSILQWKQNLRHRLTTHEAAFLNRKFNGQQVDDSFRTVRRTFGDRTFRGRIFSPQLEALGTAGQRRMTPEEAQNALDREDFRQGVLKGIDVRMRDIIDRQDLEAFLRYGVRGEDQIDLAGQSPVIEHEVTLDDTDIEFIRDAFNLALDRYQKYGAW